MIQKTLPPLGSDLAAVWVAPDLQLVVAESPANGEISVDAYDSDGNHLDTLARFSAPRPAVDALSWLVPLSRTLFPANAR